MAQHQQHPNISHPLIVLLECLVQHRTVFSICISHSPHFPSQSRSYSHLIRLHRRLHPWPWRRCRRVYVHLVFVFILILMFILCFELFERLFQDEIRSFGLVWNNLSSSVSLLELMSGVVIVMIYVKGGQLCCLLVFEIIIPYPSHCCPPRLFLLT